MHYAQYTFKGMTVKLGPAHIAEDQIWKQQRRNTPPLMQTLLWRTASYSRLRSDLPRECSLIPLVIPLRSPWYGAQRFVDPLVPVTWGNIDTFVSQGLLAAMVIKIVLPTVPGLILVWESGIKRCSAVPLQLSLNVLCHVLLCSWCSVNESDFCA